MGRDLAQLYFGHHGGDPKGVVYHHRGACLLALGNVVSCGMPKHPVYLWTVPMFHCNGRCFPWSISVLPLKAGPTRLTGICPSRVRQFILVVMALDNCRASSSANVCFGAGAKWALQVALRRRLYREYLGPLNGESV